MSDHQFVYLKKSKVTEIEMLKVILSVIINVVYKGNWGVLSSPENIPKIFPASMLSSEVSADVACVLYVQLNVETNAHRLL